MKKQKFILIISLIIVIVIIVVGQLILKKQPNLTFQNFLDRVIVPNAISPTISPTFVPVKKTISVSIDFGNGQVISEELLSQTVYSTLKTIAKDKNFSLEVKQYKFGNLVTKIGDKESNDKFGWIYLVNGKLGQIAADRYVVYPGDKIEWKYSKL